MLDTTSHLQRESLRNISSTAKELRDLLTSYSPQITSSSHKRSRTSIPPLDFPSTADIFESLKTVGLSESALQASSCRLTESIKKLEQLHSHHYYQSCERLLTIPRPALELQPISVALQKLKFAYQASYRERYLPWIRSQIEVAHTKYLGRRLKPMRERRKATFNAVCLPFPILRKELTWPKLSRNIHLYWKNISSIMLIHQLQIAWFWHANP